MGKLALLVAAMILGGASWVNPPITHFTTTKQVVKHLSTPRDSVLFVEKQGVALAEATLAAKTLAVAKTFLGTPYVNGCLDRTAEECLAVNLCELDCWTFMENSLAIALAEPGNFDSYKAHLQELRYWGGYVNGYGSRIHYFTGWLLQNEKRGLLQDLTESMGGVPYRKTIGYISARPAKYPKIKDPDNLRAIRAAEAPNQRASLVLHSTKSNRPNGTSDPRGRYCIPNRLETRTGHRPSGLCGQGQWKNPPHACLFIG